VGAEVGLATNPEFLKEGEAVHDFLHPDRIVVGAVDERSLDTVAALYKSFSGVQLVRTNNRTAEMIKYTANALWATLISFSNEIGNFCGALNGVDVVEVMRGVHLDKRLTPAAGDRLPPGVVGYLSAGCGFGGSCLPKDVKSLVAEGRKLRLPMRILSAVVEVNRDQPKEIIAALDRNFDSLAGRRVAVLGLAFKAGTDDVRESAAIPVLRMLLERSAVIQVYDPVANAHALPLFDRHAVIACDSVGQCVTGADAVVILTSWDQFRALPELISDLPEPPVVIDGRRLIDRDAVPFYEGIGFGKGRPRALRPERHAVEQNANVN
jgi:UDPglucose 6-dehydrogenase/GDP-mannose 6-dehydrogenase